MKNNSIPNAALRLRFQLYGRQPAGCGGDLCHRRREPRDTERRRRRSRESERADRYRPVRRRSVLILRFEIPLSVPAGLGKGQGANEIGHNLARAQLFSAQTTQFRVRSMKTWAQICKHKHFYIGCLKIEQQLHFVNGGKKN